MKNGMEEPIVRYLDENNQEQTYYADNVIKY